MVFGLTRSGISVCFYKGVVKNLKIILNLRPKLARGDIVDIKKIIVKSLRQIVLLKQKQEFSNFKI